MRSAGIVRTECGGIGVITWSRSTIVAALTVKGDSMIKFVLGLAVGGLAFILFRDHVYPVLDRIVGCIQ